MAKKFKKSFIKRFLERTENILSRKNVIEVKGRVTAGKLNIRKKPSLKSKVVGQVKRGDLLEIFNELGDWYQIVLNKRKTAFVYKRYVEIVREEKNGIITANTLNVRSQPNTESQVLGKLHKNDVVNILKEYKDWLKIRYHNREAFIYKTYVDMSDVPVELNPIVGSNKFFNERKDLADVPLEADKQISLPSGYHEKIAAKTWNNYGGLIKKISDELKIDVATALAVLCVESSGHGFNGDKMIIRFENHVLDMFWGKNHPDLFAQHFKYDKKSRRNGHYFRKSKHDKWEVCHTGQDMEWKVLNFAKTLDETAALKSISMGAPQIMGFNYKFIGYKSPQDMFNHFNKDIRYHLLALFDFCKYKPERIRYLQRRDFYSFSVEYNGTTAPKQYEQRLLKYYHILRNILPK
jgi:SH3-like domain-containing protein